MGLGGQRPARPSQRKLLTTPESPGWDWSGKGKKGRKKAAPRGPLSRGGHTDRAGSPRFRTSQSGIIGADLEMFPGVREMER